MHSHVTLQEPPRQLPSSVKRTGLLSREGGSRKHPQRPPHTRKARSHLFWGELGRLGPCVVTPSPRDGGAFGAGSGDAAGAHQMELRKDWSGGRSWERLGVRPALPISA